LDIFDLRFALDKKKLITETKRNGCYRILEISEEDCKQQDSSWEPTVKYEDVQSLCKYRRPVSLFNKFKIINHD
jgi:hypothetical protein